jgi:hypothetical protein
MPRTAESGRTAVPADGGMRHAAADERRSPLVLLAELARWPRRRWLAAAAAALLAAVAIGVPTDLIPNPLFTRMTPAPWWSYPAWLLSALLAGLVLATYVRPAVGGSSAGGGRRGGGAPGAAGGVLSLLAVGCPTCNKLVLLSLGTGGALGYFAPLQPALALGAVALLTATLVVRLRSAAACRIGTSIEPTTNAARD